MQLWDLSSNSGFHAQIWKYKQSASFSETAAPRHMIESMRAQFQPSGVERVYATRRTVLSSLFYAKTGMQILNLPANSVF